MEGGTHLYVGKTNFPSGLQISYVACCTEHRTITIRGEWHQQIRITISGKICITGWWWVAGGAGVVEWLVCVA